MNTNVPTKSATGWVRLNEKREQRRYTSRVLAARAVPKKNASKR